MQTIVFLSLCLSASGIYMLSNFKTLKLSVKSGVSTLNTIKKNMSTKYSKIDTSERLSRLRNLMKDSKVDVYVVPSEDAHQSEYTAPCDARREFISGFTGSAGVAIVTSDKAVLATDGRYFNQAEKQLDSNWELLKQGVTGIPNWKEWAAKEAKNGTVGVDSKLITTDNAIAFEKLIKANGGSLLGMNNNLVDKVWDSERPARPSSSLIIQGIEFSGKSHQEKIQDLRKIIEEKKATGFIVTMLDEIAWLFNLRGSDVPYNPVFFAYALITIDKVKLYINKSKITDQIRKHLGEEVEVLPYDFIFQDLEPIAHTLKNDEKYLLTKSSSWALSLILGSSHVTRIASPIALAKAIKNDVELKGMKSCQVRDGVALVKYFSWLEKQFENGNKLDEVEAADKLEHFRSLQDHFVGLSFPTISSTGPNAAIIHYQPERGSCSELDISQVYLCDSGAQFRDGTTDTTRVIHYGTPKEEEILAYTLVLKGHISLAKAVFPTGCTGFSLDILARQHLWREGLDYRHGTGHGVGSFLNVHEGPMGIGASRLYLDVPLKPGMVISDEPGYYKDGSFGIRIESLIAVNEIDTPNNFGDIKYLGFEVITMVPLCKKLININKLTIDEKKWINEYHKKVEESLSPFLKDDKIAEEWLQRETSPI